jgi:DNA-binding SARP family transcriptional activator
MEIRILGPLEVRDGKRLLELGGGKQRALIADLAINRGQPLTTDRLIEDLWGDRAPPTAAKTLQALISRLRKTLGRDAILRQGGGYVLAGDGIGTDVERLERLLLSVRDAHAAGNAVAAAEAVSAAVALFRASPLVEFQYDEFAQIEIARLEELRLQTLEEQIEQQLVAGRHTQVIPELEALVREHPLRERLRAQLMLALYRSGRQADALDEYQSARARLVDELGIEPGRELRDLEQAILQQDPGLDPVASAVETDRPDTVAGTVLVGRERELAQLRGALDAAFAGRGSLFLLVGEPGIGKSRIAEEVLDEARRRGALALVGRCWEAGGAPAYWPWVQSIRAYVEQTDPEQLPEGGELAQIVPELADRSSEAPALSLDDEGARFRLFDATARFLKVAAASRPIVLVLDDLHAADEPSLLLLQFLAGGLETGRILLIGTYRDVDPTVREPLTSTLAELARERVTYRIELGGLDTLDVRRYIELSTGIEPAAALVEAIRTETEGNPLFVGEVVRLLASERSLVHIEADTLWAFGLPQGVREVIGRRLGRLSSECTQALTLASVLGREFRLDALERLVEDTGEPLVELLDEAVQARVLASVPSARAMLRFAHALIRETLYDQLTTVRRVQLHRRAGEALETLYGDHAEPHLAELAHHFFEAAPGGDADKAVDYARRAAARALALLAYEEAARLVRTALDAIDLAHPGDDRTRCDLLLDLGEAESRAGRSDVAKEAVWEAAGLARRLELPRELARAAMLYGGRIVYERAGRDGRLVPLLEEALGVVGEEDLELRSRLLGRLAGALRDEHSRERRDRVSAEAVRLARTVGDPAALGYALDGRVSAIVGPHTLADVLVICDEEEVVAEGSGDGERLLSSRFFRFLVHVTRCEMGAAERELAVVIEMAEKLHQPAQLAQALFSDAMLALARGEFDRGEHVSAQGYAYGKNSTGIALPTVLVHEYILGMVRGDPAALEPLLRTAASDYPARPFFRAMLAHHYAILGRRPEAEQALAELALDEFAGLPLDSEWLYGVSFLAETTALLGDVERVDSLYRLLMPYAALNTVNVPEGMRGSMWRYLALLAASKESWSDADHHFSRALEANERMGLRPWLAHTQEDYARMLLGRDGNSTRGVELVDFAVATYRELGMQMDASRAAELRSAGLRIST